MSSLLAKRPKIKDSRVIDSNEYFTGINKIEFCENMENQNETLCYRYYNQAENINGHNINEWLRFIIDYKYIYENTTISNTFAKLKSSLVQPWDDGTSTVENYKRKIRAFHELMLKLGIKYWTAAVEDIIPPCETLDEIFHQYDEITDFINDLHQKTGIKLAWLSTNFPFFGNDSKLNNSTDQAQFFSLYGQQVKKAMELTQKLNTDGFLIYCPSSECKNTICVNNNVSNELKNYGKMLKMIVDYKDYIGFRGELLIGISNKYHRNCVEMFPDNQNSYLFDAFSILCFLNHYNLNKQFRIQIQTPHEFLLISEYMGNVGPIDLSTIPTVQSCVTIMKTIFDKGVLHSPPCIVINGLSLKNNDYKDVYEDLIANIDTYVAALHVVFKMYSEGIITKNVHGYTGSTSFPNSLKECDEQSRKINTIQLFKHISPHNVSPKRHWDILIERFKNNL